MEDAGNIEMEPIGPDRENPKVPEADSDVMNDSNDPNICFMLGHKYLTGDGVKLFRTEIMKPLNILEFYTIRETD